MNMIEFLQELNEKRNCLSDAAAAFLDELIEKNKNNPTITDNGKKIIKTMQDNSTAYMGVFTSKQIGEILFMPARSVSGAMRKLLSEQYVEKKSVNPVAYSLTDKGKALQFDN
jgi:predicted transcriptional regulator